MEEKKVCDKCESPISDVFKTQCESCGGTSFVYKLNGEIINEELPSEPHLKNKDSKTALFSTKKAKIGIPVLVVVLFALGLSIKSQPTQAGWMSTVCRSMTLYNGNTITNCQQQWNEPRTEKSQNKKIYIARPPDENLSSTQSKSTGTSSGNTSPSGTSTIQDSPPMASATPSPIACKPNLNCPVGSAGPGGGIVFFDAGSKQVWGRYLEVSLKELPAVHWCPLSENSQVILGTSKAIGSGASNTQKMKAKCTQEPGSASYVATQFADHGYTDWFIPSLEELAALKNSAIWEKVEPLTSTGEFASSTQFENGAQYIFYWIIKDGVREGSWQSPTSISLVRAF